LKIINLLIYIFSLKVIEYCECHRNDPVEEDEEMADISRSNTGIGNWDMKFLEVSLFFFFFNN